MRSLLLILLLMTTLSATSEDNVIRLTSLEWPPYSGQKLAQQGASVAVARAAFAAMGYQLKVDFFPWSRAVSLAKDSQSRYIGYFPEYYSQEIAAEFIYSDPMGSGPLGFIQQAAKPVHWQQLQDLRPYRIGVVQDYVNTDEFDALVQQGKLATEAVISDRHNILKVINGRLDLAVIDRNVMHYLFNTDPSLQGKAGLATFNDKLLDNRLLYICFRNTRQGKAITEIFNQGLKKIDIDAIMEKHL